MWLLRNVASQDSDQPAYPHSLVSVLVGHSVGTNYPKRTQADSEDWSASAYAQLI